MAVKSLPGFDVLSLTNGEVKLLMDAVRLDVGLQEKIMQTGWPNKEGWAVDVIEKILSGHAFVGDVWRQPGPEDLKNWRAGISQLLADLEAREKTLDRLRFSDALATADRQARNFPELFAQNYPQGPDILGDLPSIKAWRAKIAPENPPDSTIVGAPEAGGTIRRETVPGDSGANAEASGGADAGSMEGENAIAEPVPAG